MSDVPGIVSTGKNMLIKFGLPLGGFFAGWAIGDLGLKNAISSAISGHITLPDSALNILTATAYFVIGVALWAMVPYVGGFIGALLIGIGTRLILNKGSPAGV